MPPPYPPNGPTSPPKSFIISAETDRYPQHLHIMELSPLSSYTERIDYVKDIFFRSLHVYNIWVFWEPYAVYWIRVCCAYIQLLLYIHTLHILKHFYFLYYFLNKSFFSGLFISSRSSYYKLAVNTKICQEPHGNKYWILIQSSWQGEQELLSLTFFSQWRTLRWLWLRPRPVHICNVDQCKFLSWSNWPRAAASAAAAAYAAAAAQELLLNSI